MNVEYTILIPGTTVGMYEKKEVVDFLFANLDQYGDSRESIDAAIEYAISGGLKPGGIVILAKNDNNIIGAVVLNKTGMSGYIPENILVYIAVHKNARGTGLGKKLMQKAIDMTDGNIALHVEKDNPAKFLYEKMGFTNPYLEMRLDKAKLVK